MDNTKKSPNVLSLCTGYGGIERGLARAFGEVTTIAHVEIEAFAIANLVNKMETGQMVPAPVWTDLKTFNARAFRGHVDMLTGGYPCQPFSSAGNRKGAEDPRHLWPYIGGTIPGRENLIEQCRPRGVFFENVEGHLSLGVSEVLADLEKMGYSVKVGIFSAVEVGAPHQRKRVFILGELVNPKHNGLHGTKIARSFKASSGNNSKRETQTSEFERAGRSRILQSISKELADSGCSASPKSIQSPELRPTWTRKSSRSPRLRSEKAKIKKEQKGYEELVNSKSRGFQNRQMDRKRICESNGKTRDTENDITKIKEPSSFLWPSRPGEPQYEWEEPRVVGDTPSEGFQIGTSGSMAKFEGTQPESKRSTNGSERETQPRLGRATNGTASRVDRLRLLGNGVVPQVAEKAFKVLNDKLVIDYYNNEYINNFKLPRKKKQIIN